MDGVCPITEPGVLTPNKIVLWTSPLSEDVSDMLNLTLVHLAR